MLGSLDRNSREATVVGAGIAGLLAAYELDRAGFEVTLIEHSERAGGMIRTTPTPYGIAESAAHSFLASPAILDLAHDLGVELIGVNRDAKARYVLRDQRMRRFPLSIAEASDAFRRAVFARSKVNETGANMSDWATRHLGPAARDYLISPFLTGIHAALPEEISVSAAFPALAVPAGQTLVKAIRTHRRKRNSGSRGKNSMMAPRQGMQALVDALERRVSERIGSSFHRGQTVTSLPKARNLVVATPAYVAAPMLSEIAPALSRTLSQVAYAPLVSATVFVETEALKRPPRGVGLLIPARENRKILGVLFNSSSFEGRVIDSRFSSFTVMLGGSIRPDALNWPDAELMTIIREEFDALFGLRGDLAHLTIHRWPRALPRYSPSLERAWELARDTWCATPGRILFGNYSAQISLRGMAELARANLGMAPA